MARVTETAPLRWAAGYAALALVVHPCCPPSHGCQTPGKVPCDPATGRHASGWQAAAVPTPETCRRWLTAPHGPTANIGALTGRGLVWLDIDGQKGEDALAALLGPQAAPTWEYRRGDHSRRLIYRVDGMQRIPTSGGDAGHAGLRIMGDGGQAVLPPSLHVSGERYAWVPGHRPKDGLPAPAPAPLLERLRASLRSAAPDLPTTPPVAVPERLSRHAEAVLHEGPASDPARYPSRSEAVQSVVWSMIRAGHSDGAILGTLLGQPWVAAMRGNPQRWLQGEVARAHAAGARPDTLEPMRPEAAAEVFRSLPAGVRLALASSNPKRRMAGAVEAAKRGEPVEALCAFAAATGGGDVQEARAVARWAAWAAQGHHAN